MSEMKIFYGVVEDTKDPLLLGRVRVRIIGVHSSDTIANDTSGKGVAPEDLPWAQCVLPTTSGGVHGFFGHPALLEGAWVIGVSRDGNKMNELLILGTVPGIPGEANPNPKSPPIAFHGVNGLWPNKEFVGEPDYPRSARGVDTFKDAKFKPLSKIRKDGPETVSTAGGGSWSEPTGAIGSYPNVRTYLTTAGHILEFDDTPGNEHIVIGNGKTKTYVDLMPDGSIVTRVNGTDYEVVSKDKNLSVGGALNITVKGATNILCTGKALIEAKDSVEVKANKDVTVKAQGNATVEAGKNATIKAGGSASLEAGGSVSVKGKAVTVSSSSSLMLSGTAGVTISGPTIRLAGKKI